MLPTALAGILRPRSRTGEYTGVLKKCLPSALLIIAWSLLFIILPTQSRPFSLRTARRCHWDDRNHRILADHEVFVGVKTVFCIFEEKDKKAG